LIIAAKSVIVCTRANAAVLRIFLSVIAYILLIYQGKGNAWPIFLMLKFFDIL